MAGQAGSRSDAVLARAVLDDPRAEAALQAACRALALQGARFAYLHGSRATGQAQPGSDIDLAAWFDPPAPAAFEIDLPAEIDLPTEIDLPAEIDLLVLNGAPLEVAGRIALHGILVLEVDPASRVRWESMTRKIYLDELPRIQRAHADYLAAVARGG